jgi:RING finger protein 113A
MSSEPTAEAAPAVPLFKKKSRPTTSRKRETPPPSAGAGCSPAASTFSASEVVVPTRKAAANPLIQSTKRKRATEQADSISTGEDDLDYHRGPDVKWRASGRIEDAVQKEREILEGEEAEQILKRQRRELEDEDRPEDGLYHGAASYKQHVKKEKEIPKAMRVGPQKANNTIRTVTITDYQPDVCKDYKGM